jgi:2-amino-4-hydroxy-6-hydroxymethyldihydropteridine diphosphokinase
MARCFIGLGSNLGDKLLNIKRALELLSKEDHVSLKGVSPLYCTSPVGPQDQDWFINCVCSIETSLEPLKLLKAILSVEEKMGRVRERPWGPRIIDLDVLFYDELVYSSPELSIPHPEAHKRAFVLIPLMDLVPDLFHPVLKRSVKELFNEMELGVQKIIYLGSLC